MRVALLALTLAACAAPLAPAANTLALDNTHWMRVDRSEDAPHFPTLDFADGAASGHAGCNRWNARFEQTGDRLAFGPVATTRMMCAEPAMATERAFVLMLADAVAARLDGGQLLFLDQSGAITARFERAD